MYVKSNKWQKVKESATHTTLRHSDGHEITLAHNLLKPEHAAELKTLKLADGGNVSPQSSPSPEYQKSAKEVSKGFTTPSNGAIGQAVSHFFGMDSKAKGGPIEGNPKLEESAKEPHLDEGGAVSSQQPDPNTLPPGIGNPAPVATNISDPDNTIQTAANNPQLAKQNAYNTVITGSTDPAVWQNFKGSTFGPQGEAPSNFSPQAWQQGSSLYDSNINQKAAEAAQNQAAVQQDNQSRIDAGLPPLPGQIAGALNPPVDANNPAQAPSTDQDSDQPQKASDPLGTNSYVGAMDRSFEEQKQAANAEAGALGQEGRAESTALQAQQEQQKNNAQLYEQHFNDLDQERKNFVDDIQNAHIDPNQYLNNMGTGQRIDTALGLILGGMGGGLTHQGNPALEFLNRQIDRNIQGQQAELGKKENLLSANMRQFGNIRDAADMTRINLNDMTKMKLQQAASDAKTPLAAARAQMMNAQIDGQSAQLHAQMAMRQAMMSSMAQTNLNDPDKATQAVATMRVLGHNDWANDLQSKIVPGVGVAKQPVSEAARNQIISSKQVNDLMNRSLDFAQQHAGSLDPKIIAQGSVIQNQLIGSIKQAQHDGVYKPSEASFLIKQIGGNPTSFLANYSSVPKVQEMQKIKQQEYQELLKTHGLTGSLPGQAPSPSHGVARQLKDGRIGLFDPDTKKFLGYK